MVLQLPPSKISPLYFGVGNINGLLEHWQWIIFGGDPARICKIPWFCNYPPSKISPLHFSMCNYVYIYMNVWKYECMNVCMYVQNISKWKGVPYHLWAKMLHPEDLPPHLLDAQKTCGGGIFHVVRWNISQKFLAFTPPNIPGLKGGG